MEFLLIGAVLVLVIVGFNSIVTRWGYVGLVLGFVYLGTLCYLVMTIELLWAAGLVLATLVISSELDQR